MAGNKYSTSLGKICIVLPLLVLGTMFALVIVEYRFFHNQAVQLMSLKHEYRANGQALKKILEEYVLLKDQCENEAAQEEEASPSFDNHDYSKDGFIVVNRDLNYLKQSMLEYYKEQKIEHAAQQINLDEWRDYTEQILSNEKKPARKVTRSRTARKKRPASKIPTRYLERPEVDMRLSWPIDRNHFWLSSPFGPRKKPDGSWGFHYGIDMAAIKGTPVKAAMEGTVTEVCYSNAGYGNTVVITANSKYKMRYAHLDSIAARKGQHVAKGQLIGKVGDTGLVRKKGKDASHLHFELYAYGKQINPIYFFI